LPDITRLVGENLRRVRTKRGLSLSRLSDAAGVSRSMLCQIELGKSTPTVSVLWRIVHALRVPWSNLVTAWQGNSAIVLRADDADVRASPGGAFSARALFPNEGPSAAEFYELRLAAGGREDPQPYPPETRGNLVVAQGALTVIVAGEDHRLEIGDAIFFAADGPHRYANDGAGPARAYLVMIYV
jgi:transcriptional regulator with XRE-family HTH domain